VRVCVHDPLMNDARQARDEGIARVKRANAKWMADALQAITMVDCGVHMTGEEIRLHLTDQCFLPAPSHHNAWGALIRTVTVRGWLIDTHAPAVRQ